MATEGELPEHVNYRKPNVEAALRDLTDFIFFAPAHTEEFVSLEDIATRPIAGSGLVPSQVEGAPDVNVFLDEITEWFVAFGVTREECAIWIKTNTARCAY